MSSSRLVFDVGNSTVKYSEVKNGELVAPSRIAIEALDNVDKFGERFETLFSSNDFVVASVGVNSFVKFFKQMEQKYSFDLTLVSGENNCGAKINYLTPKTLGADRIANTLAVKHLSAEPCIVVDCGTAINIDVIDKEGTFVGGMITAGLETSNKALRHFAPALPDIELRAPSSILGNDTLSCIESGIMYGAIGMIESSVSRLTRLFDINNVILTGGHGELLHPLLDIESKLDPWLTLKGLAVAEINL